MNDFQVELLSVSCVIEGDCISYGNAIWEVEPAISSSANNIDKVSETPSGECRYSSVIINVVLNH